MRRWRERRRVCRIRAERERLEEKEETAKERRKRGKWGEEMMNGVIPPTTVKTLLSTNRISAVTERGREIARGRQERTIYI